MDFAHVEPLVRAVLYEGYVLYPYRASSVKNRYRWTFGGLYPRAWSEAHDGDAWWMRTEVLVEGGPAAQIGVALRFLQVVAAREGDWQEAVERRVELAERSITAYVDGAFEERFAFDVGGITVDGRIEASAKLVREGLVRLRVTVWNLSAIGGAMDGRNGAIARSLASAHVLLGAREARFVSMTDPPAPLRRDADECANVGVWPVLAGSLGRYDTILASPIILGDYPRIAPESPGDLFDGTEIDEILTLRILTLTDAEREEMRATDPRARALLARTEALGPDALAALHGPLREVRNLGSSGLRAGARVRLRPKGRADAFDFLLEGRAATIASIEEDYEGHVFVAVTVDDDPGRDLGLEGKPGHRFFFRAEEVELLP